MSRDFVIAIFRVTTLVVAATFITFFLLYHSPINTIDAYIGEKAISEAQKINIIAYWGLDESFFTQYTKWLNNILHGDFGVSIVYQRDVLPIIKESFFASFILMMSAWILSSIFGFIFGFIAALKENTIIDKIIKTASLLIASMPPFWFGLLLLMLFAIHLGLFPQGFSAPIGKLSADITLIDRLKHLFLPAIMLSVVGIAPIILHTREKVIEILKSDYILFAKALGKSRKNILFSHVVRNSIIPALTLQFASFGELFGGSVLAEKVFSYPGLGNATIRAGLGGDMQLLLAITLFISIFVFIGNFCANILYAKINPQIKKRYKRTI